MRQTLFTIPHDWFDGKLLIGWLLICAVVFLWLLWRHGFTKAAWDYLPIFGFVALVIHFLLPNLEVYGVNPADPGGDYVKAGLAIRGYGIMLVLAIVSGVALVLSRCRRAGFDPERILSLAFWMTASGIVGARLLYVIQKSDQYFTPGVTTWEALTAMLKMTEGGLVVYGSLIGGMLAAIIFFRITKLSFARTADLIAPGMMLGLAIGRIGCLMNGCCYGGLCENDQLPSLQFPAGSPPYMQHVVYGDMIGLTTIENPESSQFVRIVTAVKPGSRAEELGIKVDDKLTVYSPESERVRFYIDHQDQWEDSRAMVFFIESDRQSRLTVPISSVGSRSLPIHPTQIYAAINAALLTLVLWFFWTVRKYDGEVFALMLILYSIARFLLEIIRSDETGLFGSALTISQWVSVGTILVGFAFMAYVRMSGRVAKLPELNPT